MCPKQSKLRFPLYNLCLFIEIYGGPKAFNYRSVSSIEQVQFKKSMDHFLNFVLGKSTMFVFLLNMRQLHYLQFFHGSFPSLKNRRGTVNRRRCSTSLVLQSHLSLQFQNDTLNSRLRFRNLYPILFKVIMSTFFCLFLEDRRQPLTNFAVASNTLHV